VSHDLAPQLAALEKALAEVTPPEVMAMIVELVEKNVMARMPAEGVAPVIGDVVILLVKMLIKIMATIDGKPQAFAEAVARQETRAYYRETGRCPYCGEPAVFHDRGGRPA
jgi:hypothetical protein